MCLNNWTDMEKEELIEMLVSDLETSSTLLGSKWMMLLNQMTDEELVVVLEVLEKGLEEKLKKEDLTPFLKILAKYHPGSDIAFAEDDGEDYIGMN